MGKRIYDDLSSQGFKVIVLKERVWVKLSENVSVMSISTKIQDTILLIRIKNDIFINLNDAGPSSQRFIKTIKKEKKVFTIISGWGDDMINFFDEKDNFIEPLAAKHPAGDYLSLIAKSLSANYVLLLSSFHEYQRRFYLGKQICYTNA